MKFTCKIDNNTKLALTAISELTGIKHKKELFPFITGMCLSVLKHDLAIALEEEKKAKEEGDADDKEKGQ